MRKRICKLTSLLLTLLMVFTMAGIISAESEFTSPDNGETYMITAPDNQHTYSVYQIFTGTLYRGNQLLELLDIKWGKNGTGELETAVSDEVLNDLAGVVNANDQDKLRVIEQYLDFTKEEYGTVSYANPLSVPAGYYLIKDKDNTVPENSAYTSHIVRIVNSVVINPKSDVPEVEKKIQDTNDSVAQAAGTTVKWQDSADYDIGDAVPFQYTTRIVENYNVYETYKLIFHDRQAEGLTFNRESVRIYVENSGETPEIVEITGDSQIEINATPHQDGEEQHTFDIIIHDLKEIPSVKATSMLRIEYTSTLNANAAIGAVGNPNEVRLAYSNNPKGCSMGTTPYDKVIAFTYQLIVNKTDDENRALTGAKFKLEKYEAASGQWIEKETIGLEATSIFTFKGLDDGHYRLTETEAPAGYNSIEPIYFEITAEHDENKDDPKLISLNAHERNSNMADGSLSTTVINKAGVVLPETGGMGTGLFYIIGTILMIGAGTIIITKRCLNR